MLREQTLIDPIAPILTRVIYVRKEHSLSDELWLVFDVNSYSDSIRGITKNPPRVRWISEKEFLEMQRQGYIVHGNVLCTFLWNYKDTDKFPWKIVVED